MLDMFGMPCVWSNDSDLPRPQPKMFLKKGTPLISGKSRLVKYHHLARFGFSSKQAVTLKGMGDVDAYHQQRLSWYRDRLKIAEWFSGMKWTQKLVMLGREVGVFLEKSPCKFNIQYDIYWDCFTFYTVYKSPFNSGICLGTFEPMKSIIGKGKSET